MGAQGLEPRPAIEHSQYTPDTSSTHQSAKDEQRQEVATASLDVFNTSLKRDRDTVEREKCVTSVLRADPEPLPDDLKQIVKVWAVLPEQVRLGILAMVQAFAR